MPSLSAYHLTWVSHTLDVGYLFTVAAPYLGRWVCLHGYSSKAQPLLLTLDAGYLLTPPLLTLDMGYLLLLLLLTLGVGYLFLVYFGSIASKTL